MVKTLIKYELVINRTLRSALMYDTAEQQINEFISFLGRQIGSDRIYIFEDNEKTRTTANFDMLYRRADHAMYQSKKQPGLTATIYGEI